MTAAWRQIKVPGRILFAAQAKFFKELVMAGVSLSFPSLNQLITLAIAMMILFFLLKLAPESVRSLFRV